ncbi:hypothetical protein [Paenibacillus graminis]|uniref:hypothetical protein n=1 Tax=Paenibacillus graminis TaxID=189425 RepID=UPI002DB66E37|nr:hypothetical protein [Paenibacillus graminis]MEC0167909.1 hypothetical protein [Paenibacillus graminis]
MKRKNDTELPHKAPRNTDRIYNGSYEEYEDAADYIDMRRGEPYVLKGRVVA